MKNSESLGLTKGKESDVMVHAYSSNIEQGDAEKLGILAR